MTLKLNFPAEIEASEVVIEGRKFLLVDAAAFATLYVGFVEEPQKRSGHAKTSEREVRAIAKARRTAKETAPTGAADQLSPLEQEIAALLKKKPMTSGELIQATKRTAPSIYSALSLMRKAGQIETSDDQDGNRVNVLLAKEAAPKMHGAAA